MKIFFYFGRNDGNKSGRSMKLWKIERRGCEVKVWWGPTEMVERRPVPTYLQTKKWELDTEAEAKDCEGRRIREKLDEGYERNPRRKSE
ncbi:MAG TPA: hypothetical protein VGW12_11415 [Pyrinomonadaceae bacterium]|nr:hypothetical protein [Pyrinomonadaceae bacterium]